MKKYFLVLIALMMSTSIWACDQCSVMVGSGVLSEGHFAGLRLRYRRQFLDTEPQNDLGKHLAHFEERGRVKELYYAYELVGNYHMTRDWHITVGVPVVNNYRSINGRTNVDLTSLGDAWLMLRNQKVWQRQLGKTILSGGAGLKLPTGSVSRVINQEKLDLDMQPGTGSMDFLANVVLLYDYKRLFMMTQHTLKWNGTGARDYRYGNSLASSLDLGVMLLKGGERNWSLGLSSGPYTETLGKDSDREQTVRRASVQAFWNVGAQARYKRVLASVQGQKEFYSDVDENIIPTSHRLLMSLQYEF